MELNNWLSLRCLPTLTILWLEYISFLWLAMFWNKENLFPLSSFLQWVAMAKKGRDQIPTSCLQTHFHGQSPATSSHIYPSQWEHKPEIHLFCATLAVIFHPSRWVLCFHCWISIAGFPVGKAKGFCSHSRYTYVGSAQQVLQSVNFSMGVYFSTLHLPGRREGSWLGVQVPMAGWQLQNRLTYCRASQDLWLSMAYKRRESTAKINSFKNPSK